MIKLKAAKDPIQRVVVRRQVVRIILDECGKENTPVDDVPPNTVIGKPLFDDHGFLKNPGLKADANTLKLIVDQLNHYIGTHGGKTGIGQDELKLKTPLVDIVQMVWDHLP